MTYSPTIPQAADLLSQSQLDIQTNFSQANTIMGANHVSFNGLLPIAAVLGYAPAVPADEGKHTIINQKMIQNGTATPVPAANESAIYTYEDVAAGQINTYCKVPTGPDSLLTGIKAWAKFHWNGAAVVIDDGYNISGIVRDGAKLYTVTFTTAMSNANYLVLLTSEGNGSTSGSICCITTQNAGNCAVSFKSLTAAARVDPSFANILIIGN